MKYLIIFSISLFSFYSPLIGQTVNEKMMYVVDSIPVINDPEDGNEIEQKDVSDITVIRNKDSLKLLHYEQMDGLIFIFTKEYRKRPDAIKQIPSSKQMERKNGVWFFHEAPYSGPIIDYYYSGRKQGEGTLANGKVNGARILYYQNGNKSSERVYKDGIPNGLEKEYYEDGSLRQKGEFVNGKEEGIWNSYFPNQQAKLQSWYKNGELIDSALKYYSNGKIKERVSIKNGKAIPDPKLLKIEQLMSKSHDSDKEGDSKAAIKYCTKVIELDSTYAEAYFSRGTLKLNDFQFDQAIADFDKALQFEPFMEFALTNRAFARIRKYQFSNSRTLSKNSEITVLASKDKVPVPKEENAQICHDLKKAVFLGDKSKMIAEALSNYCPLPGNP